MREIKFRVWDPAGQQMCPVIAADFQDNQSKVFVGFLSRERMRFSPLI